MTILQEVCFCSFNGINHTNGANDPVSHGVALNSTHYVIEVTMIKERLSVHVYFYYTPGQSLHKVVMMSRCLSKIQNLSMLDDLTNISFKAC